MMVGAILVFAMSLVVLATKTARHRRDLLDAILEIFYYQMRILWWLRPYHFLLCHFDSMARDVFPH